MKIARLFRNGQSQAVRLPKEFWFEGDFVYVKKSGNAVSCSRPRGRLKSFIKPRTARPRMIAQVMVST